MTLKEVTHKLSQLYSNFSTTTLQQLEQVRQIRYKMLKKRLLNTLYREKLVSFKTKTEC